MSKSTETKKARRAEMERKTADDGRKNRGVKEKRKTRGMTGGKKTKNEWGAGKLAPFSLGVLLDTGYKKEMA